MFDLVNEIHTPVDYLVRELKSICVDTETLTEDEIQAYRKQLANIRTAVGSLMADTATTEHTYDISDIKEYIEAILNNGWCLQSTELKDFPKYRDAQKLKRFAPLIKDCVEASMFGAKSFNIPHLEGLRKNIASAKTIHELRQAVKLIIDPLAYYREQTEQKDLIEFLTTSLDESDKINSEYKRIVGELVGCYEGACKDLETLRLCEAAKKQHGLSDEEAAKVGGISRKKLLKLRSDNKLNTKIEV